MSAVPAACLVLCSPRRPRAGHHSQQDRQGHCPRDASILAQSQGCMARVTAGARCRWRGGCPLAVREREAWLRWRVTAREEFQSGESVQMASSEDRRGAFSEWTGQQNWGTWSQARSRRAHFGCVCLEGLMDAATWCGLICSLGRSFRQHLGERVSVGKNWPLWGAGRGCGVLPEGPGVSRLQRWPGRQSEQSGWLGEDSPAARVLAQEPGGRAWWLLPKERPQGRAGFRRARPVREHVRLCGLE